MVRNRQQAVRSGPNQGLATRPRGIRLKVADRYRGHRLQRHLPEGDRVRSSCRVVLEEGKVGDIRDERHAGELTGIPLAIDERGDPLAAAGLCKYEVAVGRVVEGNMGIPLAIDFQRRVLTDVPL